MRDVHIRALSDYDLGEGAGLLAARHRRHVAAEPLLGDGFTDAAVARGHLQELWQAEPRGAVAAECDGRLVGYLIGQAKPTAVWGENAWVESAGHAVEPGVSAEVVREMYAAAAQRWVDEGRRAHYVLVPAGEAELADAWWRLGFGLQHVHGIRELDVPDLPRPQPASAARIVVRPPTRSDLPALAELDRELPRHQAKSPVFSSAPVPSYEEGIANWEGDFVGEAFSDDRFGPFVAELDGEVAGCAVGCPLTVSGVYTGPLRTPDAAFLAFAAVRPPVRGRGVGTALLGAVLDWSSEQGYRSLVTDWRATNLQASRAWPALGFRPTFWRLHRLVGH